MTHEEVQDILAPITAEEVSQVRKILGRSLSVDNYSIVFEIVAAISWVDNDFANTCRKRGSAHDENRAKVLLFLTLVDFVGLSPYNAGRIMGYNRNSNMSSIYKKIRVKLSTDDIIARRYKFLEKLFNNII